MNSTKEHICAGEVFVLVGLCAGLAEGTMLIRSSGISPSCWGMVLLVSLALFPLFMVPQAIITYFSLWFLSSLFSIPLLRDATFLRGFCAISGVLLLPLAVGQNIRRPGFSVTFYHIAPYAGVLIGVLLLSVAGGGVLRWLQARADAQLVARSRCLFRSVMPVVFVVLIVVAAVQLSAARSRAVPETTTQKHSDSTPHKPNVLLISIDTLRADHLGSYGHQRVTDPEISRHFQDGLRWVETVCPVPRTVPSHAGMLTGRHPIDLGLRNNGQQLPDGVTTLAQIMSRHGYQTSAFVSAAPMAAEQCRLDRGFDHYSDASFFLLRIHHSLSRLTTLQLAFKLGVIDPLTRKADAVANEVLLWLDNHYKLPFFLFVHFYDPHSYYEPPAQLAYEMGVPRRSRLTNRWLKAAVRAGRREIDPEEVALAEGLYDAEVRFADQQVGRILDRLDELGLRTNSIVLLTSDHGETILERAQSDQVAFHHGTWLNERDIRVPLFLKGPGVPSGLVRTDTASTLDVVPTLLGLLEFDPPVGLCGIDLLAPERPDRGPVVSVNIPGKIGKTRITARHQGFKYTVELESGEERLVYLPRDGEERVNVIGQNAEIAQRLQRAALALPVVDAVPKLNPYVADQLRALGYAE